MLVLLLVIYVISCFCFISMSHNGLVHKGEGKHPHLRSVLMINKYVRGTPNVYVQVAFISSNY